MATDDDRSQHRGLKNITNSRQASKILDVSSWKTLYLDLGKTDWYVRGTNAGLWTVGIGPGGGVYMTRTLPIGTIERAANRAERVDVIRESTPLAIRDPPARVRGGA